MTASLRTVCADILRDQAYGLMCSPPEYADPPQFFTLLDGANLLNYVDAREAVELADECADAREAAELADECADERDRLQADVDKLEEIKDELSSENNKLLSKNNKLTKQIAELKKL